ncbi:MAG: dipeptidyl aminopeptidase/acylaminoacyl peptidase [Flavobacteriaceae bacterium]|jgi:dipeptidyl aminopeptidase/acylaminoacyl peptidase
MKNTFFLLISLSFSFNNIAQDGLDYQKPPQEILDLVDVELAPNALFNSEHSLMITLQRDAFKTIEEMSRTEMRLGGLRIDPKLNIGSRIRYYHTIKIKNLQAKNPSSVKVSGIPENAKFANFSWSPDQKMMAMTNTTSDGVELWVMDIHALSMKKLSKLKLNANTGNVINWFSGSDAVLIKVIPKDRKPLIDTETSVPMGPTISTSDGKKAQNRTYQDLLKSKTDEYNFEQLARSEIYKVELSGASTLWMKNDMYRSISFSPNGDYVMVTRIEKPFSYLVPYYRFPSVNTVFTKSAKEVQVISEVPLIEDLPKGFMSVRTGKRDLQWRNDKGATLIYAVALDGGDAANEVKFRDEIFQLEAPFNGRPKSLLKTINRFGSIDWGTENVAIASDYWWNTRNTKSYLFDPSNSGKDPILLIDRNSQDKYNDPGNLVMHKNEFGKNVLTLSKGEAFLIGEGYTEDGQFPFLDRFNLQTKKITRIYTSGFTDKFERIYAFDLVKYELIVRIESKNEFPNYYTRSLRKKNLTLSQLSFFKNPFQSIAEVHKEAISYQREDGLELSATLYLPVGYDIERKEKMPMIMWAYPREFKDKSSAAQSTQNPNKFTYPWYGSPVFWVTQGYVVLTDAAFPIVGEGEEEPNDSFRTQLVSNAKAAIDAVDAMGYIDRNRVAVGGHSYGAFMVANLLSHSDLFAAGIARSGAYNRTLTPFGFQSEERSYWDAPNIYNSMSPFMHADKMKSPLLLIHGEADNNSGTYPMQSERYFNALKGLGATVRLVMLPKESHGYAAKESILHLLWEQHQWLELHVKNKK